MKGYLMNVEVAEKFFMRCIEREAVTEQERVKIRKELIHEENIQIVKANQVQALMKYKKTLVIESKTKRGKRK